MSEPVSEWDIGQYDVQVCIVSGEAAPNLLPIACYQPREVILLISGKMQEQAAQLSVSILEALPATNIKRVWLEAPNDTNRTTQTILKVLNSLTDVKAVVNATGGTKLMSIAAFRAAAAANVPVFYVNQQDNAITIFPAGDISRGAALPTVQTKIEMKHYLEAYGYQSEDYCAPAAALTEAEYELVCELVTGNAAMHKAVSTLNGLVVEAAKHGLRTAGLGDTKRSLSSANLREFNRLVRNFSDAGYLSDLDDELEFPDEVSRFFVAGGWLEHYVGICLSQKGLQPWINLKVRKQARNEIDVAFFYNNRFYVVECKTSSMKDKTAVRQIAYKLESLRKIGGSNTQLILVSYQGVDKEQKEVARQSGIKVICGSQLARLKAKLAEVLDD